MDDGLFKRVGRRRMIGCLAALGGVAAIPSLRAGQLAGGPDHGEHIAKTAAAADSFPRPRQVRYVAPAVPMLDQFGRKVAFDQAITDGRPVIMNFVFTSCTTICPVMTQIFIEVQARLAGESAKVHMVSVSIDPEYDTPSRLLAYIKKSGIGADWDFYTGSIDASIAVQKAFDADRGDKMNHETATLLRGPRGNYWLRLDGFASPEAIVDAYRSIAE